MGESARMCGGVDWSRPVHPGLPLPTSDHTSCRAQGGPPKLRYSHVKTPLGDEHPMSITSHRLRWFACAALTAALLGVLMVTPASGGAKHVGQPDCTMTDTWMVGERWHAMFELDSARHSKQVVRGVWDVDNAPRYRTEALHLRAVLERSQDADIEMVFGRRQPVFTFLWCSSTRFGS